MSTPKVTVAWCRCCCHWWLEADAIGTECEGCEHKLVKRVGYLCAEKGLHRLVRETVGCTVDHYDF